MLALPVPLKPVAVWGWWRSPPSAVFTHASFICDMNDSLLVYLCALLWTPLWVHVKGQGGNRLIMEKPESCSYMSCLTSELMLKSCNTHTQHVWFCVSLLIVWSWVRAGPVCVWTVPQSNGVKVLCRRWPQQRIIWDFFHFSIYFKQCLQISRQSQSASNQRKLH